MDEKLYLEVFPKRQRELFFKLSELDWISDFYLAGGSALALQLAHRRSIDFDFFSPEKLDLFKLKKELSRIGAYKVRAESEFILDGDLNAVRISFFNTAVPLIRPAILFGKIRIASKEDIAAMKMATMSVRGSRKDFVDLFFLLNEFGLEKLVDFFQEKYGENLENLYCVLKGMTYFVDAEKMPMPRMIKPVTWGKVKKYIISAHKEYINKVRRG